MDGSCKLSNPSLLTDLKSLLSVVKTRRSMVFAYGFMFAFVACTAFFFFNSPADTSLWFTNLFASSNSTDTSSLNSSASIFSYILPDQNPSSSATLDNTFNFSRSTNVSNRNTNLQTPPPNPNMPVKGNQVSANATANPDRNGKGLSKTTNVTDSGLVKGNLTANRGISVGGSSNLTGNVEVPARNQSDSKGTKVFILNSPSKSNQSASDRKNKEKPVVYDQGKKKEVYDQGKKKEVPRDCDVFYGRWVRDESYPLYKEGSCPFIDEPFDCFLNHRPDDDYQKFRWQPNGCNIPRLNATDMLQRLRGKRLVFVGDSLNRNMWESLVCVLRNSVPDKKTVFEASGNRQFRTEGLYSFIFTDYNCSVEFFRAPFLVQESEIRNRNGSEKETLRLDIIEKYSFRFKDADILVFNTGHWWTHPKTSEGKDYYQEGDRVYSELNVLEAYKKALRTWARWVDTHINPKKTHVFFRGYSASHFRGGQWNSGGQCHKETDPITNDTYLEPYPPMMSVLESVIKEMKTPISYLNITRMTDYRKDAHPSIYRKPNLTEEERFSPDRFQDCSHWCLPGLPDTWNELLYAVLLMRNQ